MRPARKGPENPAEPSRAGRPLAASMRPARKGPENLRRLQVDVPYPESFNEAGPQGAGKPLPVGNDHARRARASMRPARKGPENPVTRKARRQLPEQASMRPARKGPENLSSNHANVAIVNASMRPARKGPENRRGGGCGRAWLEGFNEAGPQGAGKPSALTRLPSRELPLQ